MTLSSFLITTRDIRYCSSSIRKRHLLGLVASAITVAALTTLFGFDVAYLLSGVAVMTLLGLSYRLPLYVAIAGLVALMLMSPLVDESNQWERWSDRVAVQVLFMMIFGVYRMALDEVYESIKLRSDKKLEEHYVSQSRTPPKTAAKPNKSQPKQRKAVSKPTSSVTDLRGAQPTKRRRL